VSLDLCHEGGDYKRACARVLVESIVRVDEKVGSVYGYQSHFV
jgi:hypothetical protein